MIKDYIRDARYAHLLCALWVGVFMPLFVPTADSTRVAFAILEAVLGVLFLWVSVLGVKYAHEK